MNSILLPLTFVLLGFSLLTSCSKDYSKLTWPLATNDIETTTQRERSIAASENECFVEQYSIDQIKSEIKLLEKKYTKNTTLTSKFDFAKFNKAESAFLSISEDYIVINEDAKKCERLVCILNTAYGKRGLIAEEGYRIYHWFLTMGSIISTANKVHGYTFEKEFNHTDFLFRNKELKALNMESKVLSSKYQGMLLRSIHRFPNGQAPGVRVAGLFSPGGATYRSRSGVRYEMTKSPGKIYITKQPVSFDTTNFNFSGYFFHTSIHEFSHSLDLSMGPELKYDYLSEQAPWLDLSGWVRSEIFQTDGSTAEKWTPDISVKDNFMRSYSQKSPAEDFADGGAYFILEPKKYKSTAPEKYKVFKSLNSGVGHTQGELNLQYGQKIYELIKDDTSEILKSCIAQTQNDKYQGENRLNLGLYLRYLGIEVEDCIETGLSLAVDKYLYSIKAKNYFACGLIKRDRQGLLDLIATKLGPLLTAQLDNISELAEIRDQWKVLRSKLISTCDPRAIYLMNRKEDKPEKIYESEMNQCANDIYHDFGHDHSLLRSEIDEYLLHHSFSVTKDNTKIDFLNASKGLNSELVNKTKSTFLKCVGSSGGDSFILATKPVTGGSIYVAGGVLNCINERFFKDLDDSLKYFLDDKYVSSEESLAYLTEMYQAPMVQYYQDIFNSKNEDELKDYFKDYEIESNRTFYHDLLTDDELLQKIQKSNNAGKNICSQVIKVNVEGRIILSWSKKGPPVTFSSNEVANFLIPSICREMNKIIQQKTLVERQSYTKDLKNIESLLRTRLFSDYSWVELTDDGNPIIKVCEKEIEGHAQQLSQEDKIVQYKYIDSKQITVDAKSRICGIIFDQFLEQMDIFNNNNASASKSVLSILNKNTKWKQSLNKNDLISACKEYANSNINGEDTNTAAMVELNLISSSVKSNALIETGCNSVYGSWINQDLNAIELGMLESGTSVTNSTLQTLYDQNYLVEGLDQWKQNLFWIYDHSVAQVEKKYRKLVASDVQSCKDKYPHIRFRTMLLARNKCISSKALTSSKHELNKSEAIANITTEIDGKLIIICQKRLDILYKELLANLDKL